MDLHDLLQGYIYLQVIYNFNPLKTEFLNKFI
jgi:hypothetical protein